VVASEKVIGCGVDDLDAEIIEAFIVESRQLVEDAESTLIQIARGRAGDGAIDRSGVDRVFRALHSIKGTSSVLAFHGLVNVTHIAESLLEGVRSEAYPLSDGAVTILCDALDFCRVALERVERIGSDAGLETRSETLVGLFQEAIAEASAAAPPRVSQVASPPPPDPHQPPSKPTAVPDWTLSPPLRETVRVDVQKLDALMALVGELSLAESRVSNHEALVGLPSLEGFRKDSVHLNRITRDLQDIALAIQMVPVDGTFRKMHRLVRDLSLKQRKDIRLELVGAETEVDKNLLGRIADPLVHIMRNAVDHGIEDSETRLASGKPAHGTVTLQAAHRAGEVWIVVSDDGRGFDDARILARGIELGLVSAGERPAQEAVYGLVFEPGFSTAATITDVSGRGVGMDVVRQNIEQLGGRVEVSSQPGLGTTVTLRIPRNP
jgi:two-component system chemotaxis sensor kinase CheA